MLREVDQEGYATSAAQSKVKRKGHYFHGESKWLWNLI